MKNLALAVVVVFAGQASAALAGEGQVPVQPPQPTAPAMNSSPPPPPVPAGKSRPAFPSGNPASWVTYSDYPPVALRERREGTTGFRLTVNALGRPEQCDITLSSGSPDLDAATCAMLTRRALFRPALDRDGNPTTGTWSSRIRWIIPSGSPNGFNPVVLPEHPEAGQTVITFTIDKDGRATECKLVSGPPLIRSLLFLMPCDLNAQYPPYRDAKGEPVARAVRFVIDTGLSAK